MALACRIACPSRLDALNLAAALTHLTLAVVTATTANVGLAVPVYRYNVSLEAESDDEYRLIADDLSRAASVHATVFLVVIESVTCAFHLLYLALPAYDRMIRHKANPLRWLEYAVTASLMTTLIALLSGVLVDEVLVAVTMLVCTTMLLGGLQELYNRPRDEARWRIANPVARLAPFAVGLVPYTTAFAIIWTRFMHSSKLESTNAVGAVIRMPGFVYVIVTVQFVLFTSFAANMLWQTLAPPSAYARHEAIYIALSLGSKTFLAIMLLNNVLRLDYDGGFKA